MLCEKQKLNKTKPLVYKFETKFSTSCYKPLYYNNKKKKDRQADMHETFDDTNSRLLDKEKSQLSKFQNNLQLAGKWLPIIIVCRNKQHWSPARIFFEKQCAKILLLGKICY